jgi:hypothetical protein
MSAEQRDWGAWSREAVALMEARNQAYLERFDLTDQPYRWNIEHAQLGFSCRDHAVVADLCAIASVSASERTFVWGWSNPTFQDAFRERLDLVRAFGEKHQLARLTTAVWEGGRADGLEMLAVAGRILDAEGVWIDEQGDLTLFFTLHRFRTQPLVEVPWLTGASPH